MFLAHFVAGWIGLPTGIVIAAMIILRKRGMAALKARKQRKSQETTQGQQNEYQNQYRFQNQYQQDQAPQDRRPQDQNRQNYYAA